MHTIGIITFAIFMANIIVSYNGLTNEAFFLRYNFQVDKILVYRDYKRLVTSGFLHVSWLHLGVNMFSLYAFSGSLELYLGGLSYLVIYLTSLIGGNLLTLFIHRNHGDYSSVGASGAVCGIVFASIALFPGMDIRFFGIPIGIPAWIYGLAFVLFSIYGVRSRSNNIGHEAHLGGALIGMIIAIIMQPSALQANYIPILIVLVPSLIFIYIIITRPQALFIDNVFYKRHDHYSIDHKYNEEKVNQQKEIDRILEKIHRRGMSSLTKKEKETLDAYSKTR